MGGSPLPGLCILGYWSSFSSFVGLDRGGQIQVCGTESVMMSTSQSRMQDGCAKCTLHMLMLFTLHSSLPANLDPKCSFAGGFLFKQWKEKFLSLSGDGSLLVCPDANSPAELGISLGTSCGAILEGSDICDLPRLPLGAQRDSCLGLSLNDGTFLFFLAPNSQECRQWLSVLRKVKESFSRGSPSSCRRHIDPPARKCCQKGGRIGGSPSTERREAAWASVCQGGSSPRRCLRHGRPVRAGVKAACLLVGGAAAGPTLGYMVTSSMAGHPEEPHPPDFKELGYHPSACDSESQFEALDYQGMDQDLDTLGDWGGFAF